MVARGELGGQHFQAFRIEHKLDATGVAALLLQGRMAMRTIQRAILGLPITFFFKSIFAELTGRGVDSREARRKSSATVAPARGLGAITLVFPRRSSGRRAGCFHRAHGCVPLKVSARS